MPSSLEIAQRPRACRPIEEIAAAAGSGSRTRSSSYGRTQEGRTWRRGRSSPALGKPPDGKLTDVTAITPTKAGEGKTTTSVSLTQGLGSHRPQPGALPARGVARARVRDQGRRGRRRLCAGRADGGPEPALHGRHPRRSAPRTISSPPTCSRGHAPALERARASTPLSVGWRCLRRHQRPGAASASSSASAGRRERGTSRESGFDITAASEVMAIVAVARRPARPARAALV